MSNISTSENPIFKPCLLFVVYIQHYNVSHFGLIMARLDDLFSEQIFLKFGAFPQSSIRIKYPLNRVSDHKFQ